MQNCDLDKTATLDPAALREVRDIGLAPLQVICEGAAPRAVSPPASGFITFANFVPRAGEEIELEDGSVVRVTRVLWRQARVGSGRTTALTPVVSAIPLGMPREPAS